MIRDKGEATHREERHLSVADPAVQPVSDAVQDHHREVAGADDEEGPVGVDLGVLEGAEVEAALVELQQLGVRGAGLLAAQPRRHRHHPPDPVREADSGQKPRARAPRARVGDEQRAGDGQNGVRHGVLRCAQ
jgi:hypothetical protein